MFNDFWIGFAIDAFQFNGSQEMSKAMRLTQTLPFAV